MRRIAIIGSGITALAQAWKLTREGQDCTVLESSDRFGGAIQSYRHEEYLAEEGPNSIQINSRAVDTFLRSIPGLDERIVEADPVADKRFIVRNGLLHAVPTGPLSAIRCPLWSLLGKLRVLKEPFIQPIAPDQEETAADFVRRRLGKEIYQYAINPLIGGIYAGDPEKLSLRYAFPKLYALEQNHGGLIRGALAKIVAAKHSETPALKKRIISFKNGLHELPEYLVNALEERVHLNVSIESIQFDHQKWIIDWNGCRNYYDQVILTLPAYALRKLPLPRDVLSAFSPLDTIDYPPVSVISLAFKRGDVAHPLDGFGALVPECEQRGILGVLFPSSVFPHRAPKGEVLLTAFVGGERQPELATSDTIKLKTMVVNELNQLLGIQSAPTFIHHRHWPRAIPQYTIGYGKVLSSLDRIESTFPGLVMAGNYRDGISLSYCIEKAAL